MIHFLLPRDSDFTVAEYLGSRGRDVAQRISILHYEDLPAWQTLPHGTYVLAALDQLYPAGRRLLEEIGDQLTVAGARLLNRAGGTLLRLALLEELHRLGFNRHRAVRANGDTSQLHFPVFMREEHRHTGSLTPLLSSSSELKAALARAIVRGHRLRDLLVIEFCDTADDKRYFRKYAAFIVGSQIIPRSFSRGRNWMLKHSESEFNTAMIEEERRYVFQNPHQDQLRRIFAVARIEYGRIDYSVQDGTIQTWEINTNPAIGHGRRSSTGGIPGELRHLREEAKAYFYGRFRAAFEAIDTESESPPIPIHRNAEMLRGLRPITRDEHSPGKRMGLRRVLRPLRPALDRIASALSPILVSLARRRG